MKRLRFAAYVGVLSGVIVLVGLIVYFWTHLPKSHSAFEVLFTFTLAIIVFPLAMIFRDARRKRSARSRSDRA